MCLGPFRNRYNISMDIIKAEAEIKALMRQHGLIGWGWRFEYDNSVRRFGYCYGRKLLITMSRHLVSLNEWAVIKNAALHEIAHALAGVEAGHSEKWRQVALSIGCSGTRLYDGAVVNRPTHRYIATCPRCNEIYKRHRIRVNTSCGKCSGGHYNPNYRLEYTEVKNEKESA